MFYPVVLWCWHPKKVPAHRKSGPDVETLRQLYVDEQLSTHEIGRRYGGVTGNTTMRWLREAGLPTRPRGWSLKGGYQSEEHRLALIASRTGPNSHWWRGGVSSDAMRYRASPEWARIRHAVYERDNWTCQDCKCKCLNTADSRKHPKRKIQAHHVIRRRDGGLDELENLVTLCMSCHHQRERAADSALFA